MNRFTQLALAGLVATGMSSAAVAQTQTEAPAADAASHGDMTHDMPAGGMAGTMTAPVAGPDGTSHGTVTAAPTKSGMMLVTLRLEGLPEGVMAVHIHETGECTGPDFKSAGGHLAMDGQEHGVMSEKGPHSGDMPNIHVPADGTVTVENFVPNLTADQMMDDDGAAFMVHAHKDDDMSQPAGDAGDRIACGVFAAAS